MGCQGGKGGGEEEEGTKTPVGRRQPSTSLCEPGCLHSATRCLQSTCPEAWLELPDPAQQPADSSQLQLGDSQQSNSMISSSSEVVQQA